MRKNTNSLIAFFVLLVFSSAANAEILIDDFDSGASLSQVFLAGLAPAPVGPETTISPEILGGQRIHTLNVPPVPNAFSGLAAFNVGGDSNFAITQGSEDQLVTTLFYGSLGGIDLTDGGDLNFFELNFQNTDSNLPIEDVLELTVVDSAGASVTQSITIPPNPAVDPLSQPTLVGFSGFAGADLTSVESLTLTFDFAADPGGDLELGSFSAVPEPGSLALLSMGSLILLRRRRM